MADTDQSVTSHAGAVAPVIALSDGSDFSWRGVHVAAAIARHTDTHVVIIEVALLPGDADMIRQSILRRATTELADTAVQVEVPVQGNSIADSAATRISEIAPGATVVLSSVGRGRSAAVLGSVAEDLLRQLHGPIIVVGPEATHPSDGLVTAGTRILVPLDGSDAAEAAIPIAAAWGIEHSMTPWLISVVESDTAHPDGAADTYLARVASDARRTTHHATEFDVLHGRHPADAISDYAHSADVGCIVTTTHGRGGLSRLAAGSTAMSLVHRAPVPVMLVRPIAGR